MRNSESPNPNYCIREVPCLIGGGPHQCLRLHDSDSQFCGNHRPGSRQEDLNDIEKVLAAIRANPHIANLLGGQKILLRFCAEVERYRVENEDLQRYGEELTKMLDNEAH